MSIFTNEELNEIREGWLANAASHVKKFEGPILKNLQDKGLDFSHIQEIFELTFADERGIPNALGYVNFLNNSHWLLTSDDYSYFKKLSKDCAKGYIECFGWFSSRESEVYLKALLLIGATNRIHKGVWGDPVTYVYDIRESATSPLDQELASLDVAESVSNFEKFLKTQNRHVLPEDAGLYMIREYYGEKPLMELIEKVSLEKPDIMFGELMGLLEDWEKWRDYPLEWSMAALEPKDYSESVDVSA